VKNKIRSIKYIKLAMKDIWEQSTMFRIADAVHMTEIYILHRLQSDGVFPWLDHHHRDHHSSTAHGTAGEPGEGKQPGHVPKLHFQQLHACFYMRRCAEANT